MKQQNVTIKKLKHVAMATSAITMSMGLLTSLTSWDTMASSSSSSGGCYTTGTADCMSSPYYSAGSYKWCDFTGVYGPPIECTEKQCSENATTRKCVDAGGGSGG